MNNYLIVVIVGAGQIGSRYLQGLTKSSFRLQIHVIDPNQDSLSIARYRCNEVLPIPSIDKVIFYHQDIAECPKSVDLVIVSTTASKRYEVVSLLCKAISVRYWILEKILTQSSELVYKLNDILPVDSNVWVNTPRRFLHWHKLIRSNLVTDKPYSFVVKGKGWGLACNSIHFLDMISWFTNESLINISTEQLSAHWREGKRLGNWEIDGSLLANFSNGSSVLLSHEDSEPSELYYLISISDGALTWVIDEANGSAIRSDGLSIPGKLPLLSEVTPYLVDQILDSGHCDLPTLKVSSEIHHVFLRAMLAHWKKTMDENATIVPIT